MKFKTICVIKYENKPLFIGEVLTKDSDNCNDLIKQALENQAIFETYKNKIIDLENRVNVLELELKYDRGEISESEYNSLKGGK